MSISSRSILTAMVVVAVLGVAGTAVSPSNVIPIMGFCTLIDTSLLALLKSDEAVKTLGRIEKVGAKTHTLVNSNMEVQLKLNSVLASRIAAMTSDPVDIEAAKLADRMLRSHETKQAVVDAGEAA